MKFVSAVFAAVFVMFVQGAAAFDGALEGRVKGESFYIFDAPPGFQDFDSQLELRLGVLGNAWQGEAGCLATPGRGRCGGSIMKCPAMSGWRTGRRSNPACGTMSMRISSAPG